MVLAKVKLFIILLILCLTSCYKTQVPDYSSAIKRPQRHVHIVHKGDTLYSIGKLYGVDYHVLARRNRVRYPYTIYVGQRIYIKSTAPRPSYIPISKEKKQIYRKKSSTKPSSKTSRKKKTKPKARYSGVNLRWPIHGKVTSNFGKRNRRMHDGIDISAKLGTPVHAAASGEVVYSDQRISGYGKLIIIRHSRDMFTAYAHNQRNLVRKGDRVQSGDLIARVGRSGRATAPHLHFEVRRGKTPVNPLAYLPKKRSRR